MLGKGGYRLIVADEEYVRVCREDGYGECCGVACWGGGGGVFGVEKVKNR